MEKVLEDEDPHLAELVCDDGQDDDDDGKAGCLDSDCAAFPHCGG